MEILDIIIAFAVLLAVFVLAWGGMRMLQKGKADKRKAWLMILVAVLMGLNLVLWISMPKMPEPPQTEETPSP